MGCNLLLLLLTAAAAGLPFSATGERTTASTVGRIKQFEKERDGGLSTESLQDEAYREAEAFLKSYVSFPGSDKCGDWATSYAALHQRIRNGESKNPRYLVYLGKDGLGDRINGLVTSFVLAVLTSRALVIGDTHIPLSFDPAEVNWRAPKSIEKAQWMVEPEWSWDNRNKWNVERLNTTREGKPDMEFVRYWNSIDADFPLATMLESFAPTHDIPVLRLSTNAGSLTQLLSEGDRSVSGLLLKAMGFHEETAHACILRFLLRPKDKVLANLPPKMVELRKAGGPAICIHARFSDAMAWDKGGLHLRSVVEGNDKDRLMQALNCAVKLTESLKKQSGDKNSTSKWLVLSNLPSAVKSVKKLYRDRVVESTVRPRHVMLDLDKVNSMRETVQDWVLHSLCHYFIPSNSGFSKTSLAYSFTRKAVIRTDLYPENPWFPSNKGPDCDPSDTMGMFELGETWSRL